MGATAGMVEGRGLVCGGAMEEYVECEKDAIGGYRCERNSQRVLTVGGSQWITGPASRRCYEYDVDRWETDIQTDREALLN